MNNSSQPELKSNSGITLIVVLGFLAILAILGLSLAVTTRIERMASSSYADTTRARQMVFTALARALDEIDISTLGFMYPTNNEIMLSAWSGNDITNVFSGEGDLFLPTSVLPFPSPTKVHMTNIVVQTAVGAVTNGRIGFYAVNCSGLLDANTASWQTRDLGHKPTEIALSTILPELANVTKFTDKRSTLWRRFETVPELYELGTSASVLKKFPEYLFTYSMFRPDLNPAGDPKAWLGGSETNLINPDVRTNIIAALSMSGISNPELVFTNLLDYIDVDHVPHDLNTFCTEAVPMINEVIFTNRISVDATGTYKYELFCDVETWYPFSESFDGTVEIPVITVPSFGPAALKPTPVAVPSQPIKHGANTFVVTRFAVSTNSAAVPATSPPWGAGGTLGIQARINGKIRIRDGAGLIVDEVDLTPIGAATFQWTIPGAMTVAVGGPFLGSARAAGVDDPRLNYNANATPALSDWKQDTPTPWSLNIQAQTAGNAAEGISTMYVRDFPLDQPKVGGAGRGTVAELGYLSVGQPWRTIALYKTPGGTMNPVLDYFTLVTNATEQGKVNINSTSGPVIASAFYEMPLNQYPGDVVTKKMSIPGAVSLASNIIVRLAGATPPRTSTNRSIAVMGEFDKPFCDALNGMLSSACLTNDAMRESIIRNSHELFGVRQNMYTVFLYGQALTQGEATGAEQRAVAVIWRDPEEDTADTTAAGSGKLNRTFVRFFKWL